jgi:hypothetical protein
MDAFQMHQEQNQYSFNRRYLPKAVATIIQNDLRLWPKASNHVLGSIASHLMSVPELGEELRGGKMLMKPYNSYIYF